ncbi:MAG TPA: GC-type dockerin domain-anchored protein [Phycisphaerales bacterium]|nr:GC-type dockerin domain-anchored protein [Phycisphaerales bacterium]
MRFTLLAACVALSMPGWAAAQPLSIVSRTSDIISVYSSSAGTSVNHRYYTDPGHWDSGPSSGYFTNSAQVSDVNEQGITVDARGEQVYFGAGMNATLVAMASELTVVFDVLDPTIVHIQASIEQGTLADNGYGCTLTCGSQSVPLPTGDDWVIGSYDVVLAPGQWTYHLRANAPNRIEYAVTAVIGCAADIGVAGGVRGHDGELNNNDFVAFIDAFFAFEPIADRGMQGGVAGMDRAFDNNDFIVYIDQFFASCF